MMLQKILVIDPSDKVYRDLNNSVQRQTVLARDSNEAIACYSSTEYYIGLTLINISCPTSLAFSENKTIHQMLKVKNQILPTIAYYEADKVDKFHLNTFKRFQDNKIFSLVLEYKQLKERLPQLEKIFREPKPLIKVQTSSVSALAKPEIIVPVAENDHHAVKILSTYGGLLLASLQEEKQEDRLKRTFAMIGLELRNIMGWLVITKSYEDHLQRSL